MTRRNADPRPPVGPWVDEFRVHLARQGLGLPAEAAGAVESHVLWYVNALLTDPRLNARGRAAVESVFLSAGVASLRGHGGGPASRGRGSPPARAGRELEEVEKHGEDDDETALT